MPTTYKSAKVQGTSSTSTYATLLSTGASVRAVISSILVTNTAGASATYRIGIMGSAGTPAAADWIAYDVPITSNDASGLTLGIVLEPNQFIRVSSSANTVTFSCYFAEIT